MTSMAEEEKKKKKTGPFEPYEVSVEDAEKMEKIEELRYRVWLEEGALDPKAFEGREGKWRDEEDSHARHWAVDDEDGNIIAAARLTLHHSFTEGTRDTVLWKDRGLGLPVVDLSRLVVDKKARGKGVAQSLNLVRIEASRAMGARSIIATASAPNARLLCRLGFTQTDILVRFDDRPSTDFYGLEITL